MGNILDQKLENDEMELLEHAGEMADAASEILLENFRREESLQRGAVKDVKIIYDIITDRIIRDYIEGNFSGHSYVTEETGFVDKGSDFLWIIDPLDGTSNYASHNPLFSVSISLWKNGTPLLGLIEAPLMRERFAAFYRKGSFHMDFLRDRVTQAAVSDIQGADRAYGVYCEGGVRSRENSLAILNRYYMQLRDVRKLGSAALELAFVGTGRCESYMTTGISLWDIAAGILFVHEAGGEIVHFDGTLYDWGEFQMSGNFDLIATNGRVEVDLADPKL